MALPISPSNGFITRLLQQTTQTTASDASNKGTKVAVKADQTSISDEARQANKLADHSQLESKLIELYNKNGSV